VTHRHRRWRSLRARTRRSERQSQPQFGLPCRDRMGESARRRL